MINNILQCCYTNASRKEGGILSSGWQAVCVSPDLPGDAFSECTRIQNANSTINGIMKDESGNILNLFEISGDGSYIYILRTQYGLTDRLGRANMFSHAYVFSAKSNDIIADPNSFLTISNENFQKNEEDAMRPQEDLIRLNAFDIATAMNICGLDKEKMLKLVKSVYAQMTDKKIVKPLFIRYNGDETVLRALLYCIYSVLPFSMRKRLSVASVYTENMANKNIVFSIKADNQEYFCDPATGENNILTERSERRITRLGFLDHAIKNIYDPRSLFEYFSGLEDVTIRLGDSSGANELLMKIAHCIITTTDESEYDKKSEDELDVLLSDALRSDSVGSKLMDNYIALLLSKIVSKKMVLSNENDISLSDRVKTGVSSELIEAVDRYRLYMFNEMPMEKAIAVLEGMSDKEIDSFSRKLDKTEKGRETLDYFYSAVELRKNGKSWDGIQEVIRRLKGYTNMPETDKKIIECATALYNKSLKEDKVKKIVENYKNYKETLNGRLGGKSEEFAQNAKNDFWKNVGYYNIELDMYDEYRKMEIDTPVCKKMIAYCKIARDLDGKPDYDDFFRRFRKYYLIVNDKNAIKVLSNWIQEKNPKIRKNFEKWLEVISGTKNENDVEALIELYNQCEISDRNKKVDELTFSGRDKKSQLRQIVRAFGDYVKDSHDRNLNSMAIIAREVINVCTQLENQEDYLRLDTWLRFGSYIDKNSFCVFDCVKPLILCLSEEEVIGNSKLIKDPKYIEEANDYIKDHGSEYKTVKKWMIYAGALKPGIFGRFTKLWGSGKEQEDNKG